MSKGHCKAAVRLILDTFALGLITKEDAFDLMMDCTELSFNMGKLHGLEGQNARDKDADAV